MHEEQASWENMSGLNKMPCFYGFRILENNTDTRVEIDSLID
jgi:hypothetical protein